MENNLKSDFTIDAVILWVDGKDPKHQIKMEPYLEDKSKLGNKNFRTRFDQVEEIKYSVESILKYAPYVRNIFLVTDNQIPKFLNSKNQTDKYEKVTIVDHKEIFIGFEKYLPVFNSISIETMMHRIPNLSEHFIYFNDDMFLIKETKKSDFFVDRKPVIRGKWSRFDYDKLYRVIYYKFVTIFRKKQRGIEFGYKRSQQNAAKLIGMKKYLRLDHTPTSINKSTIEEFFKENPDILINNICTKFRHSSYFLIQSLSCHIEIQQNNYVLIHDYQLTYFQSFKKPFWWYKLNLSLAHKSPNKLFLCLQSLDQCPPKILTFILNWLKERLS